MTVEKCYELRYNTEGKIALRILNDRMEMKVCCTADEVEHLEEQSVFIKRRRFFALKSNNEDKAEYTLCWENNYTLTLCRKVESYVIFEGIVLFVKNGAWYAAHNDFTEQILLGKKLTQLNLLFADETGHRIWYYNQNKHCYQDFEFESFEVLKDPADLAFYQAYEKQIPNVLTSTKAGKTIYLSITIRHNPPVYHMNGASHSKSYIVMISDVKAPEPKQQITDNPLGLNL